MDRKDIGDAITLFQYSNTAQSGGRAKVLNSCGQCHRPDGIESSVRNFPPSQSVRPSMTASNREEEALRAWVWKRDRYEWGLLQGLILAPTRE